MKKVPYSILKYSLTIPNILASLHPNGPLPRFFTNPVVICPLVHVTVVDAVTDFHRVPRWQYCHESFIQFLSNSALIKLNGIVLLKSLIFTKAIYKF